MHQPALLRQRRWSEHVRSWFARMEPNARDNARGRLGQAVAQAGKQWSVRRRVDGHMQVATPLGGRGGTHGERLASARHGAHHGEGHRRQPLTNLCVRERRQ